MTTSNVFPDVKAARAEAAALADAGRLAEAIRLLEERLEEARLAGGPDHPFAVELAVALAALRRGVASTRGPSTPGAWAEEIVAREPQTHEVVRHATVRYRRRVPVGVPTPLLVSLSARALLPADERNAPQSARAVVTQNDTLVEVEPVLPGCTCQPAKQNLHPEDELSLARFDVTPTNSGAVAGGRVIFRQNGKVLAEIAVNVRGVRQWPAVVAAVATAAFTLLSMLGEQPAAAQVRAAVAGALPFVAGVPVWALALATAVALGAAWWWHRPRPDTFLQAVQVSAENEARERLMEAYKLVRDGKAAEGERRLELLAAAYPNCQPAWLLLADLQYERERGPDGDRARCLPTFRRAIQLGPVPGAMYGKAAVAVGGGGDPREAIGWVRHGLSCTDLAPADRAVLLFNLACYNVRLGRADEALASLAEALAAGFTNAAALRADKDLDPLRGRKEFLSLVAKLGG